ncbi:MAG TPA: response regulator [Flavobacterium sp.]|jgi:DNA-binding NarL/FixJ family response regulator
MFKKNLKVLVVDDHQLMVEGYISILQRLDYNIEVMTANNCEAAEKQLRQIICFDIILLDRSLPSLDNQRNGDDLALLAKQIMPDAKILILTSHSEGFALYSIVHKIKPDGLLVKCDFNGVELLDAVVRVLQGGTYKSSTVTKVLKGLTSKSTFLDNYNRQIVVLLSQGIKTKNLSEHIPLSNSAIDKRKVYIKEFFGLDKSSDEDIIKAAKKEGFI